MTEIKKKSRIIVILKMGALILMALGVIGSAILSSEEKAVLKEAEYSWEEDEYAIESSFNGAGFLTSLVAIGITCSMMYGLGEVIELQSDSNALLREIAAKKEDEPVNDDQTKTTE